MPIWGPLFSSLSQGHESQVQQRITNLVNYVEGVQGLSKYDPKTGEVLEQVTLEPGSCDPHGLGFYKGAFIGCDAGHHPGWPDKDGPGAGWIFRIETI